MTIQPITISTGEMKPEFVPVPKPGTRDPHTGLSRSYICQLIAEGKIQSVSLRRPGHTRGKRLIRYSSLISFINAAGGEVTA
ncbi:MAG TPA: hypothetical protein PLN52_22660 [Opitutaceae bacterium]|nr:hypothetical protein [Opitutaceae bacterium]